MSFDLKLNLRLLFVVSAPFLIGPAINFTFNILVMVKESQVAFGSYSFVMALCAFVVGFSDAGFKNYLLSRADGSGDRDVYSLYSLTLSLSFLMVGLLYLFIKSGDYSEQAEKLWVLVSLEVFALSVLHKGLMLEYQIKDQLSYFSKLDLIGRFIYGLLKLSIYLATSNLSVSIFISGFFFFSYYYCATFFYFKKSGGGNFLTELLDGYGFRIKKVVHQWRLWGAFGVSFFSFFLYFTSNRIIISFMLGEEALAVFAAAYLFVSLGEIPISVFWAVLLPRASEGRLARMKRKLFRLMTAFSVFLCLSYAVFSFYFYEYFFSEKYSAASSMLVVMSLYFLFRYPNLVFEIYASANKTYQTFTSFRLYSAVAGVVANLIFVPIYGVWFSIVCMVLCEALVTLLCIRSGKICAG